MVVHPVAHGLDDPSVCACAHGADVAVAAPALTGILAVAAVHTHRAEIFVAAATAADIPARAPPAAA